MTRDEIFRRISEHRDAMDARHGRESLTSDKVYDEWKLAILAEEFGEVARAVVEGSGLNLQDELFDVAQVVVAWLECE